MSTVPPRIPPERALRQAEPRPPAEAARARPPTTEDEASAVYADLAHDDGDEDCEDGGALTIGELADHFAITTRAIRFYEARGLLAPRRVGANRSYTRRDKARLTLILRGKNLGFSLEDIADYLALYDADPTQEAQTRLLLDKVDEAVSGLKMKRADIDRTMRDLKEIRARCVEHLRRLPKGGGLPPEDAD